MVNSLNKLLCTIIVFLVFTTTILAAEITATVDRNPIPVGESFQFTLDARGSIDEEPDFTELQQKFRILNRSQSSNFRFINGSITKNKIWTMLLIADKPGSYIIPAISLGKDKSEAIPIKIISNILKQTNDKQPEFYLELVVEPESAYVQQQIIYTIKLFRRIQFSNASLSEPISENDQAIITRLGTDTNKKIALNGIGYSVLERRYAIFPQKSGKLKISPIIFETQIIRNTRQRSIKRIKSRAVEIQIKGIPAEFTRKYPDATWLPVENLTITESWSGDIAKFQSGEPMTRTISLTAQNISAAQLPDIKFKTPKNIKTYPDVPVSTEQNNKKGLIANKQFKTALLPTKVGGHELSKIVIPWWNTNTDSIAESNLPAHSIHVETTSNQAETNKLKLDNSLSKKQAKNPTVEKSIDLKLDLGDEIQMQKFLPTVWIIITTVLAVLWLLTMYLLLRLNSRYKTLQSKTKRKSNGKTTSIKEIKNACRVNDAQTCSKLLVQWANNKTGTNRFTNLSSLIAYTEPELKQAIEELELYLYSNKQKEWDGARIWLAFKSNPPVFTPDNQTNSPNPKLASLYANYE